MRRMIRLFACCRRRGRGWRAIRTLPTSRLPMAGIAPFLARRMETGTTGGGLNGKSWNLCAMQLGRDATVVLQSVEALGFALGDRTFFSTTVFNDYAHS